jgi:hypothetical protein
MTAMNGLTLCHRPTNVTTKHQYIENLWRYGTDTQMTPDQLIEEKAKSTQDPNLRGLAEDRLIQ